MPPDDAIDELIRAANALPDGEARLALTEEAVRVADSHGDIPRGYQLRQELIRLASACLRYDLYASTFSWCLSQAERDPTKFPVVDLLWWYQDVIGKLVNFPDITRAAYEELFTDAARLIRQHGYSLRGIYLERRSVGADYGSREMALEADGVWHKYPRDRLAYSIRTEAGRELQHRNFLGDWAGACEAAERYLATRAVRSEEWVVGEVLLPLFLVGRVADALRFHRLTEGTFRNRIGYMWHWGPHMTLLALTDNYSAGLRCFEAALPVAMAQPDLLSRFHFLEHAVVLFDRVANVRDQKVRLRVPSEFAWYSPDGMYDPAAVQAWLDTEARAAAERFDARNANDYFATSMQERRDLLRTHLRSMPLPDGRR